MSEPLLEVRDLRIWLPSADGPAIVVRGIDIELEAGQVLGIAGESGSGKSLTASAILGLLPAGAAVTGSVRFEGRELLDLSKRSLQRIRGQEIAMIFQDPMTSLHPMLRVETLLTEHLRRHQDVSKRAARARAEELLELVRVPDPRGSLRAFAHQFSGGMRQRLMIASALACDPKLLIADEPTTALDVTVQAEIIRLLDQLRDDLGIAIVLITHDLAVLAAIADEIEVFYAGRVVERGTAASILAAPRHPYTRGLLDALPAAQPMGAKLEAIPGRPPHPMHLPDGCAFHPRCGFAVANCQDHVPPLVELEDGRLSACPVDPLPLVMRP